MSDSVILQCDKCGKECKDKKGLAIHQHKCNKTVSPAEFICLYCNTKLSTKQNLQRHYDSCKLYVHIEEAKLKEQNLNNKIKNLESQIEHLSSKNNELKENIRISNIHSSNRYDSLLKEKDNLEQKLIQSEKKSSEEIKKREEKITSLEKEVRSCWNKIDFWSKRYADKDSSQHNPTTIQVVNKNNISNSNQFLFLQNFDPSLIQGYITPPDTIIRNASQLVDKVINLGLRNIYRVTDRSRKSLVWKDDQGNVVQDTNGSQIAEKLIDVLVSDITEQLVYYQNILKELEGQPSKNIYQIQDVSGIISFTKKLLSKEPLTMKEIEDVLVKKAKHKSDNSVDVPKKHVLNNFSRNLEQVLFPRITEWMFLSFRELGKYIGSNLKDIIKTEGASLELEDKYFVVKNDSDQNKRVLKEELYIILKDILSSVFNVATIPCFLDSLKYNTNYTTLSHNLENIIEWIENDTDKDMNDLSNTEEIIIGIVTSVNSSK